ncbi:hypothetical protein J2752_000694 [Halarchaeum rubridurum]|uniref:Uncharacterized protein n=1 Tax=Halarchaeum rubridurum TaxID=489911 RepID=A0A830FK32_9EURY|nr:hypothetical protein [Halarchaeum rubridurum]MBP1953813.1 hypothetical protein [Halarchaeum rubridurum]GGM54901.1 hypothetical protein GCM10009017_01530 [Halarchaeum rubridurum]
MSDVSRRRFLGAAAGAALAWGATGSASAAGATGTGTDGDWRVVDAPTSRALHDVARAGGRVYAVGGGGVVLERTRDGEWRVLAANGPDGNGSNLHAAASDGERVWVAGASGALAVLDAAAGDVTTHRAPDDVTNQFTSLALVESGDDATVHVADSSGQVHVSRGRRGDGRDWTHVTPGSGAAIRDVTADGERVVAVDANAAVFETRDGGASWDRLGIDDADAALRGVALAGGTAHVVGGALYSETGAEDGWDVADPCGATLADVEIGPCGCVHAVGANGTVLHRPGHGIPAGATLAKWLGRWETAHPVSSGLDALVLGDPHVAVGANGTVVER